LKSFPIILINNNYISFNESLSLFDEPLIQPNINRFNIYPIHHDDIFQMYKKARASFWQPEEISLKDDMRDWNSMSHNERHFVSHILAFFSASDGIVNENLNLNFASEVQFPEARAFYTFQTAIESIHSETYGLLLDKYIQNPTEKSKLQRGMQTIPSVQKKASWALKWTNSNRSFAHRLIAFACVEGIMFSGSFCAIFWLKKRGLMPGLSFSNELIARDESLHTEFAILLYTRYIKHKIDTITVHNIVKEAVEHEKEFILESLPCSLIGMNSDMMSQYIEYVADLLLVSLGYPKVWNASLPETFNFMETISLSGKTNFFEKRVGEYAKAGVMNTEEESVFDLNAYF
jgi:ribonucleoside-diphosphate reductase beta chain